MSTSYRSGARRSLGLLCAALILGPVMLVACGSVAAPGSAGAANGSPAAGDAGGAAAPGQAVPARLVLCSDPAAADRVVISRSATVHAIQPERNLAPGQATVAAAARVRALAKALCALPRMPKGPVECPALFAGTYRLRFTVAGRVLPVVTIQETGCQTVTGLGPVRTVSRSPAFWTVLAAAVGPSSPVRPFPLPSGPAILSCSSRSTRLGRTHCPVQVRPMHNRAP